MTEVVVKYRYYTDEGWLEQNTLVTVEMLPVFIAALLDANSPIVCILPQ